ncbi:hypothetical protein ABH975_002349 [Bradyrhizobium ottawaense]
MSYRRNSRNAFRPCWAPGVIPTIANPGAVLNMLNGCIADRKRILLHEEKAATKSDIGGNLALMYLRNQVREAV